MKKFVFIATLMSVGSLCYAQDFIDNALLLSRPRPSGSARIQALGGTQVSLVGTIVQRCQTPQVWECTIVLKLPLARVSLRTIFHRLILATIRMHPSRSSIFLA